MAVNREIERKTTRAYTTNEGVSVTEEHLLYPLRRNTGVRPLTPIDVCEFNLVTFEKSGCNPVHWVRESDWNQCSDKHFTIYVDATIVGEIRTSHGKLQPEDMTVYVERKGNKVGQLSYFTPPLGKGECDRYPQEAASRKAIDDSCKANFGCQENLATQHLHTQDISKEILFEEKEQGKKAPDTELWKKVEMLKEKGSTTGPPNKPIGTETKGKPKESVKEEVQEKSKEPVATETQGKPKEQMATAAQDKTQEQAKAKKR